MLNKVHTGLVVVDIQGKLARIVADSQLMIANCCKLIKACQSLNLPIIWLEQAPGKLGSTIGEISTLLPEQQPVTKFTFDACGEPGFVSAVKKTGKTSWLVCGIEAHICVYQTAAGLNSMGYEVHLVGDCVSSRHASDISLAVNRLAKNGVAITGLEMCLYELLKDCRAPEFKPILNLIK